MDERVRRFYEELDERYRQGDKAAVETFLCESARDCRPCGERFDALYLACLSETGAFYCGVSKYEKSVEAFLEASEILLRYMGASSPEYATNLNNLAGAYRLMGKYEEALPLFLQAKEIYRATVGDKHYLYASVLNNLSLLYQNTGNLRTAVDYLKTSVALVGDLPDCEEEQATGYSNLSILYRRLGETENERQALQNAVRLMPESSLHYPALLGSMAAMQVQEGNLCAAEEAYTRALEGVQRFFGKNAEYAAICEKLADVLEQQEQHDRAAIYMREAYEAYTAIGGRTSVRLRKRLEEMEKRQ